ncbi:carbohydrate ABC transporter membrane protein 1, CUT1 family [Andreprevotia lacus DSM 23236]|jgi:multiple sugar transport system permease protein|uniref:Carbohydrate ABC transporter membrane protein 1, CUT1 family n=1 Tax=Andreprevotia lacus DSM 23236 TaxID=1121001 RepID=A0A1W1X2Y0_9NEIS|nr:sugar ABC transporter permease [Andreprevotia lacus]SMC18329.1 carbohydrate ABC transporter membrane protein 1, CUT1 family [Andreprevotia lacus DSM 23236]
MSGTRWAPYLFAAPFFVLFLLFVAVPFAGSLWLAFQHGDAVAGLAGLRPAGWQNFRFAWHDPLFWASLANTLVLTLLAGIPQHVLALALAWAIYTRLGRLSGLAGFVCMLPYVTSSIAIALVFMTLFSNEFGLLNQMLARLGLGTVDWLHDAHWIKFSIALLVIWRYTGWNTVLYLTALQNLPPHLLDAATLDGATGWRRFRSVVLPQLRPMLLLGGTLTLIGGCQLFDEAFILAPDGGTTQSALTTSLYIYRLAFINGDMGSAAAMAWLLLVSTVTLIVALNLLGKERAWPGRH